MKAVGHGVSRYWVPAGTPLGGYLVDGRTAAAGGLLDAHVLVLQAPSSALCAQVVLDAICVNRDLAEHLAPRLQELGIQDVQVSATHSHSAPEWGCFPGGAATPAEWFAPVEVAVTAAARLALDGAVPVVGSVRRISVAGVGSIRNADWADYSVPVDVIDFRDERGDLLGIWANVPVHATVLPANSRAVSGDLIADTRSAVAERTGGWCVVTVGAAGDVSTRGQRREPTESESARLGAVLAAAIVDGVESGPAGRDFSFTSTLRFPVTLPGKDPRAPVAGAAAGEDGASQTDASSAFAARRREAVEQAREVLRRFPLSPPETAQVTVLRCGRTLVVGVPVEPLSAVATQLEAALQETGRADGVVLMGYSGGYLGYLPAAAGASKETYEAIVSPFAPGAAETLINEIVRQTGPDADGGCEEHG